MKQISKLESGKTYSLSQIFSKDFWIAIPDLQRDYCWGLETYNKKGNQQGELISGFLSSLKSKWEETRDTGDFTPMGLIYGYEWPKGTYQLCDGQQRLTTFYLLAGELYRNELVSEYAKKYLRDILIKVEQGDRVESPTLRYSIRETTLYFLSDLVEHYFLGDCDLQFYNLTERSENHLILKYEHRPSWYFLEYDNDPTIQSMLGAIYTIRNFLKTFSDTDSISSFAMAIATRFSFIYYDMGNRTRGEETFVVLNTSGEPLTATENLKPLLLGGLHFGEDNHDLIAEISKQWEDREDWFWKHRNSDELTSDKVSGDFYTWWLLIYGEKESVNLIKDYMDFDFQSRMNDIHKSYESLAAIIEWIYGSDECKSILSKISEWKKEGIDCSSKSSILSWLRKSSHREIILSLIAFHDKYGKTDIFKMLRRLAKHYYIQDNLELREILNIISQSENSRDVLTHASWYNDDERQKEALFRQHDNDLLKFELDDNLRFDLNVLWQAGVNTIEKAEFVRRRLGELHELSNGCMITDYGESKSVSMSNMYRLLRFLKRWGAPTGKQNQVNSRYWCVWFTPKVNRDVYLDNRAKAYCDADFPSLLNAEDLHYELDRMLKRTIADIHSAENIFSQEALSHPEGIMRAWLISKFLVNNTEEPRLISTYNGYSLGVNKDVMNKNKIDKDLPMSIGNVCLHYFYKNGTYDYENNLNSPLYKDFVDGTVSEDTINQTTAHLQSLLNAYLN